MPPRFMATVKETNLGKEKIRGFGTGAASNSSSTNAQRRPSESSTGKQVPNNSKPTRSLRNDNNIATKNVKKASGPEDSPRPNLLRRKSIDRPPSSASRAQKPLVSSGPSKPTKSLSVSSSFSSRSTTAIPKATSEMPKKPNIAAKPRTLSSSRSMNYKSTSSTSPSNTKKGIGSTTTTSPPSKKIPTISKSQEILVRHHHHQVEEVVKLDTQVFDEMTDDFEIPKAEKVVHLNVINSNTSTNQYHDEDVKTVEEVEDSTLAAVEEAAGDDIIIISTVLQEHNHDHVPSRSSNEDIIVEDKFHHEENLSHHAKHDDEDKENDVLVRKEEMNVDHEIVHQEIIVPNYAEAGELPETEAEAEAEAEAEDIINASDEVSFTKEEIGEEKQIDESQVVGVEFDQSIRKEEIAEEAKVKAEAAAENVNVNVVNYKSQLVQTAAVHKKKEIPTPYNDVIEETAIRLREERKNKVRALVGAFETVIDKETSNANAK